jgi:hypothetical protein
MKRFLKKIILMRSMNNFYVYEYVRLDTNEPFYIGKGKDNRWKSMKYRSPHFKNICKSVPVAVVILHDNLNEQTAFEYECWYIWKLRDVEGYSLVNIDDGGSGRSGYKHKDSTKELISNKLTGKVGENNRARTVLLVGFDGTVFERFRTVRELLHGDWKNEFPKPNSTAAVKKALETGIPFHGCFIEYEK